MDSDQYNGLNLDKYPSFATRGERGKYGLDPSAAYKCRYLGKGSFPVLHPDNVRLRELGEELGVLIAGMYTSLHPAPELAHKTRIVPDSGSFEQGAAWLRPHIEQVGIVSFDTEASLKGNLGTCFAIFGAADGYVLIADLREENSGEMPSCLARLLRDKLVIGSNVKADIASSGGHMRFTGDTKFLSGWVQRHRLSPYPLHRSQNGDYKLGLKHLPELIYGLQYGPLKSLPYKNSKGKLGFKPPTHLTKFPQPYQWPLWLHATRMYDFSAAKITVEQIAYMRNDGCSPHIHLLCAAMLYAAEGSVNPGAATVKNALLVTAGALFHALPDTWEAVHGIPRNLSTEDLMEEVRRLPSDSLRTIKAYDCFLDMDNAEAGPDQAFLDLHGGPETIKRIHALLEKHPELLPGGRVVEEDLEDAPKAEAVGTELLKDQDTGEDHVESLEVEMTPAESLPAPAAAKRTHTEASPSTSGAEKHGAECKRARYEFTVCSCPGATPEFRQIPIEDIPLPPGPPPASRVVRPVMQGRVLSESIPVRLPTMLDVLAGRVSLGEGNPDISQALRPPRLTGLFSTHERCGTCGARTSSRHTTASCPTFVKFKAAHLRTETGEWDELPCKYQLCSTNKTHFTKSCPHLHALCLTCGYRGHDAQRCRAVHVRSTLAERRAMFEEVALIGMSTRKAKERETVEGGSLKKANKRMTKQQQRAGQAPGPVERRVIRAPAQPEWDFHPVIPSLTVVSHSNKCYLVTWTEDDLIKFFGAPNREKEAMLFAEFDR